MAVRFEPGRPGVVSVSQRHLVTVLNVDDSEAKRHVRGRILESAGFRVIDASTAAAAWDLVLREEPDVVLLDVALPDGDGFELTRRIKANLAADVRVVQISALFTDCAHRVQGLDSGADAYLIEPTEPAELRAVVQAVARSRRTENLLTTLIDDAPMLILGADADGRVVLFNPACEAATGFRREDVLGRPLVDTLVYEEDRAAAIERIQSGIPASLAVPHAMRLMTSDGGTRRIEWRCFSIPSPTDGEWVIGLGHDVTERLDAERAVRESELHLATALECAGMGMWELDLDAGTCRWSHQTGPLFGLSRGTNAGSLDRFLELVHPDDRSAVVAATQAASQRGTYETEFRTIWPDGSVHWIAGRGQVVRGAGSGSLRLIGIGQEITRPKLVAQKLQEANQRKDAFIATVAHELRQPLTPMVAALELMKRRISRESGERARGVIERQTAQMQRLVDDMIDASRIAQGKIAFERRPVDVRDLVSHTCETMQPLFDRRLQQFSVSVPDVPMLVLGDAGRLQQALSNVLSNAAKYSDEGARIWLTVEPVPAGVVLRVRDTGRGIEPHLLPTLFDFFVQGTPEVGGLGLGLAIVKRLVEAHGGTIEARSDGPGMGSEFTIRLPGIGEGV